MADITGTFTVEALNNLFPQWTEDPSKARAIGMARLGEGSNPLDPEQDNVHEPVEGRDITDNVNIVLNETDPASVTVHVLVEVADSGPEPLRGKTLREIGLFVDVREDPSVGDPDWTMIWVGKIPDMYVPDAGVTGQTVSFRISIPIKFANADEVKLITNNQTLEADIDKIFNTIGNKPDGVADSTTLWTYVKTMNGDHGSGSTHDYAARLKADSAIVGKRPTDEADNATLWGRIGSRGYNDQAASSAAAKTLWGYVKKLNGTPAQTPTEKANKNTVDSLSSSFDILSASVGTRPAGSTPHSLWENVGSRGYPDTTYPGGNDLWSYVKKLNGGTVQEPRTKADYDLFMKLDAYPRNILNRQAHCDISITSKTPSQITGVDNDSYYRCDTPVATCGDWKEVSRPTSTSFSNGTVLSLFRNADNEDINICYDLQGYRQACTVKFSLYAETNEDTTRRSTRQLSAIFHFRFNQTQLPQERKFVRCWSGNYQQRGFTTLTFPWVHLYVHRIINMEIYYPPIMYIIIPEAAAGTYFGSASIFWE